MSKRDPFELIGRNNSIGEVFKQMKKTQDMLFRKNVKALSASALVSDLGDLDFRAVDSTGTIRMIMSAINLLNEFGVSAHFVGFAADGVTPTIWIDADTGVVNLTSVNFNGTTLQDALVSLLQNGWIFYQRATVGTETRVLRVGLESNGTYPAAIIEYFEPGTAVSITNADFATLDLTGWTATSFASSTGATGEAMLTTTGTYTGIFQNSTRFAVSAGSKYSFSFKNKIYSLAASSGINFIAYIKFYTALSGGSLVSTETIGTRVYNGSGQSPYTTTAKIIEVPATATHAIFYLECTDPLSLNGKFYFDDFVVEVTIQNRLTLDDSGLSLKLDTKTYNLTRPHVLDTLYTDVEVVNTTTETNLWSVTLPANSLGVDGAVEIDAVLSLLNNSGSARTFTLKFYYGATSITIINAVSLGTSATRRLVHCKFVLRGNAATNSQLLDGMVYQAVADGALTGNVSAGEGTAAIDSTSAQTIKITAQHGFAGANVSAILRSLTATLLPNF